MKGEPDTEDFPMMTVSLRDLRGGQLKKYADMEEMVGLTNHRVLVAVLLPATAEWVAHLVETNVSRVEQNIQAGEDEFKRDGSLTTLEAALDEGQRTAASNLDVEREASLVDEVRSVVGATAEGLGSVVGQVPVVGATAVEALGRIWSHLGGPSTGSTNSTPSSVQSVRIGDLDGAVIEEAARQDRTIAVTHGRVLVGVLMPVSKYLVEHLVEENMSRVLYNIAKGEMEISAGHATALDDVLQAAPGQSLQT
jgi:hypothetical protein